MGSLGSSKSFLAPLFREIGFITGIWHIRERLLSVGKLEKAFFLFILMAKESSEEKHTNELFFVMKCHTRFHREFY